MITLSIFYLKFWSIWPKIMLSVNFALLKIVDRESRGAPFYRSRRKRFVQSCGGNLRGRSPAFYEFQIKIIYVQNILYLPFKYEFNWVENCQSTISSQKHFCAIFCLILHQQSISSIDFWPVGRQQWMNEWMLGLEYVIRWNAKQSWTKNCKRATYDVNEDFPLFLKMNVHWNYLFHCFSLGIFAYLNFRLPRDRKYILDTLIKGLQRQEYRGYDSAGDKE